MANLFAHQGLILPMGGPDFDNDDAGFMTGSSGVATASNPRYRPGQPVWAMDDFGYRIFRYMHNKQGAATIAGQAYVRAADIAFTITGGTAGSAPPAKSSPTITAAAATFTANALYRRMFYYRTNSVTAGAAPEGESGLIVFNNATQLTLDADRPLSAAPNNGDSGQVHSLFDFIVTAGGENAINVFGVSVSPISDTNWGLIQQYGYCPDVKVQAATAIAAGVPVVTNGASAGVANGATSASKLWVGWAPEAVNNPNRGFALMFLNVYSPFGPGTAS